MIFSRNSNTSAGRSDRFSVNSDEYRFLLKAKKDDYIPVASLGLGMVGHFFPYFRFDRTSHIKNKFTEKYGEEKYRKFMRFVKDNIELTESGLVDKERDLKLFLDDNPIFKPHNPSGGGHTYDHLFEKSISLRNTSSRINMRNANYYTNGMFLATLDNRMESYEKGEMTPLWSMMTKRENYNYLKLCYATNTEPIKGTLEFWMRNDIDVVRGNYKNLRSRYRKILKPILIENEIEIKEFDELDLFHKAVVPKFKTPSEKRSWSKTIFSEALSCINDVNQLRVNGFNLQP